jgi:SGNH hydrolase-like domain, acetyltransferase AlgX
VISKLEIQTSSPNRVADFLSNQSPRKNTAEAIFTALLFAVCLLFFCISTVANFCSKTVLLEDNRLAAECPSGGQFFTYARDFEKYFNDRFADREKLIAYDSFFKLKAFKISASSDVLVGKNDFFFCCSKGGHLGVLQGTPLFSAQELNDWKNLLERRTKWCKERGIDYVFMLAPDKPSIYPEYLPSDCAKSVGPTRADQLISFLQKSQSSIKIIDLRAAVRTGKGALPLYLKTDTHWNQLGAYYGYQSIVNSLRLRNTKVHPPMPLSAFRIAPYVFKKGDLARLQGLLGILTEENIAVNRLISPNWAIVKYPIKEDNKYGVEDTTPFYCELKGSVLPRALMFRDSFACYLAELFLPGHFSKIAFYWQPEFSEKIVLKEKPNIVMQEELETCLYDDLPSS